MTSEEDKARMLAFADDLDAQADALEAEADTSTPVAQQPVTKQQVTQQQVQVQQGPPASDEEKKK